MGKVGWALFSSKGPLKKSPRSTPIPLNGRFPLRLNGAAERLCSKGMEKENETKAEQVVNPWEVSAKGTGKIDYDKLIDQFVAKSLVAKSHELSLAYDEYSLQKLEPPLVLQEFVNHGGVLFKVYIVGDAIKVVRRFSLTVVSKHELSRSVGVFRFPRVSSVAQSADDADLDPCIAGYGKMPEYEHIFTDFLLNLAKSKYWKQLSVNPSKGRKAVNHLPTVGCRWWPSKAKHAQKVEKEILNWFSLCYGCTRKEMGATTFLDEQEGMRPSIHPWLDLNSPFMAHGIVGLGS
ncbi:hypothetical protein L6452_42202 [Arctium lappa]|uniref:Uncharacterized protein n=1 Tax=Arctium lappa TaxID=4217 RepID=A0ACB8XIA1_ARCLA|nr:hypothetical protein L6452_42202 [Arctium lappa]